MLPFKINKASSINHQQSGFALIDALVAIIVLGMVITVFFIGLSSVSRADFAINGRSGAEALARSQMEYIKVQDYANFAIPGHGDYDLISTPAAYTIEVTTVPIERSTGQPLGPDQDDGVQLITVTISHQGESIITLESYKANL